MPILKFPDPHLRYECQPIRVFDVWLRGVCRQMFEEIEGIGVGLAAPQVGLPFDMFIMAIPEPRIYINPVIELYGKEETQDEACLSIPGLVAPVARHKRVKIHACDTDGKPFIVLLSGLAARCAQHEYDHLRGLLFTDRVTPEVKQMIMPPLDGLAKKYLESNKPATLSQNDKLRLQKLEERYCYGNPNRQGT